MKSHDLFAVATGLAIATFLLQVVLLVGKWGFHFGWWGTP
jgi:hypothetical protein